MSMDVTLHKGDLPNGLKLVGDIAVDTETTGLHPYRDRLCLVQLSDESGAIHLVQLSDGVYDCPNLKGLLTDTTRVKLFHFARFDVAMLKRYLSVDVAPVYCTKIASRLVRTYTDQHGLKNICKELLGVDMSKQQQSSDWAIETLSQDQINYAASDVLYLHQLRDTLNMMLVREGRMQLAEQCMAFLTTRAALDLQGWGEVDIFAH